MPRRQAGWRQHGAADTAGTSVARVSRFEGGQDNLTLDALAAYAANIGQHVSIRLVSYRRAERELTATVM